MKSRGAGFQQVGALFAGVIDAELGHRGIVTAQGIKLGGQWGGKPSAT